MKKSFEFIGLALLGLLWFFPACSGDDRLKIGVSCQSNSECMSGLCHANICADPYDFPGGGQGGNGEDVKDPGGDAFEEVDGDSQGESEGDVEEDAEEEDFQDTQEPEEDLGNGGEGDSQLPQGWIAPNRLDIRTESSQYKAKLSVGAMPQVQLKSSLYKAKINRP